MWINGGVPGGDSRGCAPQRTRHGQGVGHRAAGTACRFVLQRMGGGENRGFSGVFSACFVLLEMSPGSCEVLARMDCHTLPPSPAITPEKIFSGRADEDGSGSVLEYSHTLTGGHTRSPLARTPKRRRGAASAPPASRAPPAHTTTLPHSHTHHASA